jgi:ion channel-forming bestrophin family protein
MIIYETNKNFLRDITHFYRSWTMQKVLRSTLSVGLLTTLFCVGVITFHVKILFDASLFSLFGIVLSILLVFRTNTAYDRWWEGRIQWGTLVNNCRNLAIMIHVTFPKEDKQSRTELAALISNFCIALKEHLRNETKLEELILLSNEMATQLKTKKHIPNYIALLIHQKIQLVYKSGIITDSDILNMKPHLQALLDVLGACERIKKTPIPFSYSVYVKILILSYTLLLPFGLVNDFGYFSIPLVMFIFFVFMGLELMASEIEDPFGLDCNDLPIADIAHHIKGNVFEILEVNPEEVLQEEDEPLYAKVF